MTFMSHIIYHVVQDQVPVPPFEYSTSILMLEGSPQEESRGGSAKGNGSTDVTQCGEFLGVAGPKVRSHGWKYLTGSIAPSTVVSTGKSPTPLVPPASSSDDASGPFLLIGAPGNMELLRPFHKATLLHRLLFLFPCQAQHSIPYSSILHLYSSFAKPP